MAEYIDRSNPPGPSRDWKPQTRAEKAAAKQQEQEAEVAINKGKLERFIKTVNAETYTTPAQKQEQIERARQAWG